MSKKSIEFHIKVGDYFGTLAALLSLVVETKVEDKECKTIFKRLIKDLIYLQSQYRIVKR